MSKGRLIVISGPSGAGKGTICDELFKDSDIKFSVSMTTRDPRSGEVHGKDYFFVTTEEFEQTKNSGGFLEYAENYGNCYGTPKKQVMEMLDEGFDVVLEIDPQGALQIKEVYPESVFIFILPPSMSELRKRITGRGSETKEDMERRLNEALKELSYIDKYDYCVVNGILSEAVSRVKAIITAEHCRVSDRIHKTIEKYKEEN